MRTMTEKMRRSRSYKKNKEVTFSLNFTKYGEYKCECCSSAPLYRNKSGESHSFANTATVDHILDLSKGGSNDISNLRVLCFECNNDKSNKV